MFQKDILLKPHSNYKIGGAAAYFFEAKKLTGADFTFRIPSVTATETLMLAAVKAEGKTIFKTVVFYLAKTREKEIKISPEHTGFVWLSMSEALPKLIFKNAKEILKKANNFILRQGL